MVLAAVLLCLAVPRGLAAWSLDTEIAIAEQAMRVAPPHLRRQVVKRPRQYRSGVEAAYRQGPGEPGRLDAAVAEAVEAAVRAIEGHRPFDDIAFQLGVMAHWVAASNNPLNGSGGAFRHAADYQSYVESVRPRFAVMFYGGGPAMRSPAELRERVRRSLERARAFYPSIGREYQRIGGGSGVRLFDDRSTAFGVGALAYSHAVSDTAEVLRYVWLRAGGADSRRLQQLGEP